MIISGLATTGFTLPNYTNIWIDLDDSTLSLGAVTGWTDRVHSIAFTNSVKTPFLESTGLRFYGTNSLRIVGSAVALRGTNAFFLVYRNRSTSTVTWKTIWGNAGAERGLMMKPMDFVSFANGAEGTYTLASAQTSNVWYDVVYSGGPYYTVWTNGVASRTLTVAANSSWSGGVIGVNQIDNSGGNDGVDNWIGEIRKIVYWTNGPTTGLTTNDALILHQWATNQYNYSP